MLPSVAGAVSALCGGRSLSSCLRWDADRDVRFHLISRDTGRKVAHYLAVLLSTTTLLPQYHIKYVARAFFFLHTINAYEEAEHVVVDICGYDR